jgi:hypothetical protein
MDFKELTDKISTLAASKGGVGKTIKFATSDGAITINPDGTVSNTDGDADCTIGVSSSDLAALMSGDLNPMSAFMFGKLKVTVICLWQCNCKACFNSFSRVLLFCYSNTFSFYTAIFSSICLQFVH